MGKCTNIERNKMDYLLTDILPVEVSELFSFGNFYEYLLNHNKEINKLIKELNESKANGEMLFEGGWPTAPLKYNILKGVTGSRELNIVQPISALNIYFFMECFQKEILSLLNVNSTFSLRYHRKNNDLFYKNKRNKITNYFFKTSSKINKGVIQQTGAYFKIHKFNSVASFMNSRLWQQCNLKYKYFAKVDYKACFDSIYTHSYKWIIESNTIDSKEAKNSNLLIAIDRILQNINGKSSNGLIVGPEFSRMIAEILLQQIDSEVEMELKSVQLIKDKDYRIFRYVDDIYIFADSPDIIDRMIKTIEKNSQTYLLKLNELKYYKSKTPVVLNLWLNRTRTLADLIADLFYKEKEVRESQGNKYLVKNGYISAEKLKSEFTQLMVDFSSERRYIVSFILSTLLNNIGNKKDGINLFDDGKTNRAFVLLDLAMYVYSYCPCFEHTQKLISMIVYFDDELKFNSNSDNRSKLINLIRRYSIVFENANLNDICNWFVFFYEYKISLVPNTENILIKNIRKENNPLLWANYLIYSQYDKVYYQKVLEVVEEEINRNLLRLLPRDRMLQKEFWYVLVFYNCPYISVTLQNKLMDHIKGLRTAGATICDKALNLLCDFLELNLRNSFFYWGYYKFSPSKQLAFRTYQRTMFKQYKNKRSIELCGSLST